MIKLTLVTPEKTLEHETEVQQVSLPAYNGELTLVEGHAPLMTTIDMGVISYTLASGEIKQATVFWGYCEVTQNNINVLAEISEEIEKVDQKHAQELKAQAVKDYNDKNYEYETLQGLLEKEKMADIQIELKK